MVLFTWCCSQVEQRLLSQDELIKANRLEIERRAQAAQQQAMAWGKMAVR